MVSFERLFPARAIAIGDTAATADDSGAPFLPADLAEAGLAVSARTNVAGRPVESPQQLGGDSDGQRSELPAEFSVIHGP